YWQKITQIETQPLPKDHLHQQVLAGASESITVQWNREETEQLLKQVPRAYNTEVNDILLTALGMALHSWSGLSQVKINLEGHGREEILPELDITRTVGWFTSQYPVLLEIEEGKHLGYQIKSVKEALRQIPNKGIGYGIWRYLSRHAEGMEWGVEPEISFNYLGQFDQDIQAEEGSPYSTGATSSDKHLRSYALDLNGMVSEGELMLDISYSPLEYHRGTIEKLAQCLKESLQAIITHCITKEKTELTPSDVLLKGLTIEEVEQIVEQTKAIGEIENIYRLTPMQKGMLFHSQMDPQSGAYFDQLVFTMRGHLSVDLFRKSFHTLMQRHAVLRTNFYSSWREEPFQIVYRKKNSDFYFEDLCQMSEDESAKYTQHFIEEDKKKGFALEQDALMRLSILRVKEREYTFIWSSHHILMDGWCMPILTKELFEMYFAYQNQQEPNLEMIPSYSAYIEWLEKQDNQIAANYWKEYLANYEQQTLLPQRKQQKTTEGYVSEKVSFDLGKSLTERIDQVTKQYQVTMNTLIQAAWGVLLQKYNNADDVVFGSVVSGRPAEIPGIEKMIGLFINTIPVRIHGSAEEAFDDLMRRVQAQAIASQEYDYYPLYEIQAQTEQKQNLINHILVFENFPVEEEMEHQADQWSATDEEELDITDASAVEQTNYDFNVTVIPGNEIRIRIEYNSLVYDAQILNQIQNHFIHLLEQIANDPQISIKALAPVTDAEENQLIEVFNNTATDYPREQTLHQLFEEQVKRTPEAVAVSFGNEQLSYTELNARANQLAHRLQAEGVQTESLVGILVERSIETVVGILAILKAGGAYVPIDPSYPVERMEYILQDSGARWLLIQGTESVPFPFQGTILHLSAEESYSPNKENVYSSTAWNDLAYIIYTSGSTGQPKGTLITHRNVIRVVKQTNYIDIEQADRVLQLSSFAFDGSTFDLYGSLLNGARLVLIKKEALLHMESLAQIIEEENISLFFITTALFNALVDQDPSCLKGVKNILFGGEKVSVSHVRRALETVGKGKLIHVYGPTESTVFATAYPIHELHEHVETIPIGYPISQTEVYILDRHHQLQPIGVPGEICIAGDGLARGYLHQSELTAEKFIAHPFKEGEILYKTGDLAKWLPDGSIEYIDRMDHQVKIRGFRIELGEINHRISQINGMKESIVIAKQNEKGSTNLCAYYVATEEWEGSFLRQMLAKELPNYMIPSYFVQLEQMPLTPNGKIDRKALPEPEESMITRQEYVAPRTEEEKILTEIWKEVLGIQSIGVKDDFFDLGGHSLKMMQLVHLIRSHMNIEVPLNKLFELSTLEEMAQIVVKMKFETGEHQAVTKLNHEGPLNVFCFPPGLGYGVAFYEIAQHLDKHCVLYGLDFIDDAEDHEKMLTQYVDTIVGIQEQSPYVLMGYSLGGNLAFEVAKVMESRGLVVSDIFIIDAEKRNHLTEISPVQMEEQVQYLLEDVAENMIESVRKKIHAYMMYNNQLINTGVIQANIHALVADGVQIENPEESDVLLWRSSTVQQATEYEIRGEHDEVFESPYIEENARIIQRIVKKIIEKQSSLIDERVLSR
ncbi:non-ribosomal peptide synthetase, partial [Caldalkalibacillus mannanilyticus]|uniref:non-ribosomal peptide synthetase n=1 Tax=Caldalkalibacillus mannanilyticus TaxID=1418 RepID=UPI000469081F